MVHLCSKARTEMLLFWIVFNEFSVTTNGFILGQPLSNLHDVLSAWNLCPALDCGPIESSLFCDYADRYEKTMLILGAKCPGCPACRDAEYFKEITDELVQQVESTLQKVEDDKQILADNKLIMNAVRQLYRQETQSSPSDLTLNDTQWAAIQDLMETNVQELDKHIFDTAFAKAVRYLEENEDELGEILIYGQFLEQRLDLNTQGFYQNLWQSQNKVDYYADLPMYERYRYDELLLDLIFDKLSLVTNRLTLIDKITTNMQEHAANLTAITDDVLSTMNASTPLLLRRVFQLIESTQGALQVYQEVDLNAIKLSSTSISNILLQATKQEDEETGDDTVGQQQQGPGPEKSVYSHLIGGP